MDSTSTPCPKVVFWFRVYAACMTALYGVVLAVGIALILFSPSLEEPAFTIVGPIYTALGAVFAIGYAFAFVFRPSPFSWVYNLVLICIGFGGCPTIAAAIPLLIFWIKPETRQYYGKT